jgi:hypothetical protein
MPPFAESETAYFVSLALLAAWKFPVWGQRVLILKRDWDAYRRERGP